MNTAQITDRPAALALFLLERTGSIWGQWLGRLTADEQRALMGRHIGKGRTLIDGEREEVCNVVKVCFGHDTDRRNVTRWSAL